MIHISRFVIQTNSECSLLTAVLQCSVRAVTVHVGCSRMLFKRCEPYAYLVYIVHSIQLGISMLYLSSLHICHWMSWWSNQSILYLRTVPTKYRGFYARLGTHGKSRSLQGLLESTKKTGAIASHFYKIIIISLESQQKCWHQHFLKKEEKVFLHRFP